MRNSSIYFKRRSDADCSVSKWDVKKFKKSNIFYPKPVLDFGYCHRLRPCVRVSVYQSLACLHDNSSLIQASITKFGPDMQNTLFWIAIVFEDDRLWPSRSNLTWKSNFTSFSACPHHNLSAVQARITKFGPKMHLSTIKIPINLRIDLHDPRFHFQTRNLSFYQIYLGSFCIMLSVTRRL